MKQSQNKLIGSNELRLMFSKQPQQLNQSPRSSMATASRQQGCHFTTSSQAPATSAVKIHRPRQSLQRLKHAQTKMQEAPDQIKDIEEPKGQNSLARKSWLSKQEEGPRFQSPLGIVGVQKVKPIFRNKSQFTI